MARIIFPGPGGKTSPRELCAAGDTSCKSANRPQKLLHSAARCVRYIDCRPRCAHGNVMLETLLDFLYLLNRYLHIICTTVIVGGTLFFELIVPVATGELKQE